MRSWYKISQNKPRQFQFDNAENIFYKVLDQQEPFQENDILRVYHAFRSMNDAIITAKHGVSGQDKASRVYSYESNNNPFGLFVTTNFTTSKEFTTYGAIMEFTCKFEELEIPVWPGGGYTTQGEMAQYWDSNTINEQRQKAILKEREDAKQSEYPAIANSSRPELAQMLMSPSEYQALFVGDLNPSRISSFWIRDQQKDYPTISDPWKEISREQLIEQYPYQKYKGFNETERMEDQHLSIEMRVFSPEEIFEPSAFINRLGKTSGQSEESLMRLIKEWTIDETMHILSSYVWPKQLHDLEQWITTIH